MSTKFLAHLDGNIKDVVSGSVGVVIDGPPFSFAPGVFDQSIILTPDDPLSRTTRVTTVDCSSLTDDFCFEFFTKLLAFGSSGSTSNFFAFGFRGPSDNFLLSIAVWFYTGAGATWGKMTVIPQVGITSCEAEHSLVVGENIHVAIERKEGVFSIYINGVLKQRIELANTELQPLAQVNLSSLSAIRISSSGTPSGQVVLDEIRLSDTSIYNEAGFTPPAAPFTIPVVPLHVVATTGGKLLLSGTKLVVENI